MSTVVGKRTKSSFESWSEKGIVLLAGVGSRGDWGEVSHVWGRSVVNDCKSCGGMVAVKREPGRVLEADVWIRYSWVGRSEVKV